MIAPITMLASWLLDQPTGVWLLASLLIAPPVFLMLWWVIQSAAPAIRWPVMQYFGWGAVLLPLVVPGAVATLWLPAPTVGAIVLILWLTLGIGGLIAATRIAERVLAFDHPLIDRPYKLVQLSDIHVGSRGPGFLKRAIDQAIAHKPDALLLTGDIVDTSAVRAEHLSALKDLPCPVYLSIGNHERYIDADAAVAMFEQHGVNLLRSRAMTQGRLQIIGIDDADDPAHVGEHLPTIDLSDQHYRILLYHRPDGWASALQAGVDLMLAGHTHGGQIWPFNYLVKRRFQHLVGLFSQNDRHLYVSPGTGCWGPIMRLGTRNEMTVIDLTPSGVATSLSS
jgi:predicted MPP superfamily phosphohydrolase